MCLGKISVVVCMYSASHIFPLKNLLCFYVFRVVGLVSIMCFVLFLCVKSERCDVFRIKKK